MVTTVPEYRGTTGEDFVGRFYSHKRLLELETATSSFMRDTLRSPHFLAIVGMGELAVPLIVRELSTEPSFLFLALGEITGENPVPPSSAGKVGEIVEHWLSWADRQVAYAD